MNSSSVSSIIHNLVQTGQIISGYYTICHRCACRSTTVTDVSGWAITKTYGISV